MVRKYALTILRFSLVSIFFIVFFQAHAQTIQETKTDTTKPKVHIIYFGGNDCPPCVVWRGLELPKLQKTEAYKSIVFSIVTKSIRSPVPGSFFLPSEVKPLKEKLDFASSGVGGSPQAAMLVNGEVYDYFRSTRSAEEYEKMILAVQNGTAYPFNRCKKLLQNGSCAYRG